MEKQAVIASLLRDDIARKIHNAKNGMHVSKEVELLEIWHKWAEHVVKQQLTLIEQYQESQERYKELEGFFRLEASENIKLKESNRHLAELLQKYEKVNSEMERRVNGKKDG